MCFLHVPHHATHVPGLWCQVRLEEPKTAYGSHTTGGTRAREDCANLSTSVNMDESERVIINSLLKTRIIY